MMQKQIIRPHFAVSTCCTVLSSHGDDPSWIQYGALFFLSMESQEQTFYCSYLLQMIHILSRTCSYFRACRGQICQFQLVPVIYLFHIPKNVTLSQKIRLGWPAWWAIFVEFRTEIGRTQNSHFLFLNIARRPHTTQSDLHLSSWTFLELLTCLAVLTSSELLSCVHAIPSCSSSPRLLEQNALKAVGRTQIEGSCKLYAGLLLLEKHVTLSQKMRLVLTANIPLALLTSSEVLACAHRADMSLDISEKCQLIPVRIPSLFEQNVLKAVGGTQIEGSCKVYAGKTNWITNWKLYRCLASKKWGAIEALADDSYPSSIYLFQSTWQCRKRWVSVASQHSIGLIDIKWGTFHAPTEQIFHLTFRRNANLFQWEVPACSNRMSQKQSARHR